MTKNSDYVKQDRQIIDTLKELHHNGYSKIEATNIIIEKFSIDKERAKLFYNLAFNKKRDKFPIRYVRAVHGKKLIHIKQPNAMNNVTLCRRCSSFVPAKKNDAPMCADCEMLENFMAVASDLDYAD